MITTFFKHLLIVVLTLMLNFLASAQKLPSVQQNGKKVTAKIKIDGKLTEWGKPFEAYNGSTELYYTVANDADNLYFAIQPRDLPIIKKIIGGGITISFNSTGKKGFSATSVTYPMIPVASMPHIGNLLTETATATDSAGIKRQVDSLTRLLNREFNQIAKEIKVTGVPSIPDFMLSVYNDMGIKAAVYIDNKRALTYELAIPIKYLEFINAGQFSFYYQIVLNGLDSVIKPIVHDTPEGPVTVRGIPRGLASRGSYSESISYPTDFWGYYTLVK